MIILLGLLSLREGIRGKHSVLLENEPGRWERVATRAALWMFGLCWPLVAFFALKGT
jgi:hypothetical protein